MATVRVATFNLENLDETPEGEWPSLVHQITPMRPQIARLRADVACFQEVHGQERPGQPRALLALAQLLDGTNLDGTTLVLVSTKPQGDAVYDVRNLVVPTHCPCWPTPSYAKNTLVDKPTYRRLTASPADPQRSRSGWNDLSNM